MNFLPPAVLAAAHPAAAVTAGIRPQHLRLAPSGTPASLEADVRLVEALGTETVVHATTQAGAPILATLPARPPRPRHPHPPRLRAR